MRNRRRSPPTVFASVLLLMVFGLAACSSSGGGNAAPSGKIIDMTLIKFKPDSLQVKVGEKVTWTQSDAGFHSVVSGIVVDKPGGVSRVPDGKFKSKGTSSSAENCKCELATGQTFSFIFDKPGTYPYYCSIHPATMRGEVRVR